MNPSEVTLTPRTAVKGVVIVANTGPTPARGVTIEPVIGDPASVGVEISAAPQNLRPGASASHIFTVTRLAEGSGQETGVRFLVRYSQAPKLEQKRVAHVAVAGLTVKAARSSALVEARIESSLENINENRPGEAALVLVNPRETSVTVREITVTAPAAVDLTLSCPDAADPEERQVLTEGGKTNPIDSCPLEIDGRSRAVLHLGLSTDDVVAPGRRLALIEVEAADSSGATETVSATLTFTVDVFAESDILKAIGVPIFLLLPGVVVWLVASFFIRNWSPWRRISGGTTMEDVVSKATATAVFGLAISLIIARIYPWLTSHFPVNEERDYVKAYSFRDFYLVFAYSFAIAILAWIASWIVYAMGRWLFLLSPGDNAAAVIRKLGIRGIISRRTSYPRVTIDGGKRGLAFGQRPSEKTLVLPAVTVARINNRRAANLAAEIESDVRRRRPFRLWWKLRRAVREDIASIAFRAGDVPRPELVDAKTANPTGQVSPIVEVLPRT